MHILFLSCNKATELIEKKLHIKLSFFDRIRLPIHKSMCSACRAYEKQSILIDKSIKNIKPKALKINIEELKKEITEKIIEK